MHDFVIKSVGPHTKDCELYLDGMRLQGVTRYELAGEVADVHRLTLEMYVGSVNKDDELLRTLVERGAITK